MNGGVGACTANVEKKRVLVIGGDHQNTLATIRALSNGGIAFDLIVHGRDLTRNSMVESSRYAFNPVFIDATYESIKLAIEVWLGDSDPSSCILLPSSDLAALVIDECFKGLGVLASGFESSNRRICDLMDKGVQARWASSCGIPVARSIQVDVGLEIEDAPIEYPLIVKPVISAEGRKADIAICLNREEYRRTIADYGNSGYQRALVQELINYDHEITCIGLITLDGTPIWRAYEKKIIYPSGNGSTVYARLITDPSTLDEIEAILRILSNSGYRGLCDLDLFKTAGSLMLNEINFRQSGIVAFLFHEGIFLPLLWTRELLGLPLGVLPCANGPCAYDAIDEIGYLYHVKEVKGGFGKWLRALGKTGGKTLLYPGDNGPFRAVMRNTFLNQVKKVQGRFK